MHLPVISLLNSLHIAERVPRRRVTGHLDAELHGTVVAQFGIVLVLAYQSYLAFVVPRLTSVYRTLLLVVHTMCYTRFWSSCKHDAAVLLTANASRDRSPRTT